MEQHPVPQNVTTFQFRLIGDMTIKQFGFLAGGLIIGYVVYKLPLPAIFTWPLAIIIALLGIGFAFVPVEERPMDVWFLSFLKSVYSPTQYMWQKMKPHPEPPLANSPLKQLTAINAKIPKKGFASFWHFKTHRQAPTQAKTSKPARFDGPAKINILGTPAASPSVYTQIHTQHAAPATLTPVQTGIFSWFTNLFHPPSQLPTQTSTNRSQPSRPSSVAARGQTFQDLEIKNQLETPLSGLNQSPLTNAPILHSTPQIVNEMQVKAQALEDQVAALKSQLHEKTSLDARVIELQQQLTEVLTHKEKMEKELQALRQEPKPQAQPIIASPVNVVSAQTRPTVNVITAESAKRSGLPKLTTFPNVVTGIAKDSKTDLLPGVLVTVRDKNDVPLRALKTNKLGQFAASTPLPNGTYFIEIEDPRGRYVFDRAQVTLTGGLVPALEIVAKSQKEITRAQLEKQVFGNT